MATDHARLEQQGPVAARNNAFLPGGLLVFPQPMEAGTQPYGRVAVRTVMNLDFTKMHGLGNDFVVINGVNQQIALSPVQLRHIADRHFGVGCDQILLVEPARDGDTDFYYRIFNADGGEVEQCGNGARCFAHYVRSRNMTRKDVIEVGTHSGPITLYIEKDGDVRVNMGRPVLDPPAIPFIADQQASLYSIEVGGNDYSIGAVSMGNPHAVLQVDSIDQAPVQALGPLLEQHPRFPHRVNVGFMEILNRGHIRLRVFERGTGETLACGTGACAAVVTGQIRQVLDQSVRVSLLGGDLVIKWRGRDHPVWMSGPATRVYDGRITL